jgi:copper resistance protein C
VKRISTLVVTVAASTLALAGIALAHAHYASSTPAPGQTLAASPAAVVITFDSELGSGSTGTVAATSGEAASTGAAIDANDRTKLSIALKPSLPNGVYKVSWHSVSADDGDELDGTFFFGVGVPAPSTATAPNQAGIAILAAGLVLALTSLAFLPRRKLAR